MKRLTILAAAATCSACVSLDPYSQPVVVPAGSEPTEAQVEPLIRDYLSRVLKDPDSLKQFKVTYIQKTRYFIGAPIRHEGTAEGWLACFEYNAKNSYGGYVGVKTYGLVFRIEDGHVRFIMTQDGAIMAPRCS